MTDEASVVRAVSPAAPALLVVAATSLCAAATGLAAPAPASGPQVQARLRAPSIGAAGGRAAVVLEMTLGPGWHVNSHSPSLSFLIPTTATVSTSSGSLSEVRYPQPVTRKFEFSDEPLAVYQGTVRFESELSVPANATGVIPLGGVLSYQPCNDSQCYPPAKATLSATVAVGEAPAKGK